ncbi:PD-(D/E)XK nuclease-like domain-containing protein [Actinomadura luteofluorescens]|uniref:PD-(D/E)XK nuclease-like domain-containing protein n=1 Tax=Actinomadura luteofluorescens TaxID=46163 RepID=UPI00349262A8
MTAAAEAAPLVIERPGVYDDVPAEVYHADPVPGGSLSSSEARRLLPPSCPALFRHYKDNPQARTTTKALDFGSAAHAVVLEGDESPIVAVNAENYRTKAAQQQRDAARAAGKYPLLPDELETVREMAAALKAHPLAAKLLEHGRAERSLFWADPETGVRRRARLDWHRERRGGRVIVPDYKTAVSAEPRAFGRAVREHGYHVQAPWYLDGLQALDLAGPDAAFVFIVQEKTAPYVVTVAELDADALALGQALVRRSIEIYQQCTETGIWPGYSGDIVHVSLPPWAADDLEAAHG